MLLNALKIPPNNFLPDANLKSKGAFLSNSSTISPIFTFSLFNFLKFLKEFINALSASAPTSSLVSLYIVFISVSVLLFSLLNSSHFSGSFELR